MQEIIEILDSIKTKTQFKKLHMEIITEIFLNNEDIDPDELESELRRWCGRVNEVYSIIEKKLNNEINKQQADDPSLLEKTSELFTIEDMEKPWEITEKMGYMVYQDKASTKNLYYIKSFNRIGDQKEATFKNDEKSLIPLLNSFAYQQMIQWNKPKKVNGQIVSFEDTIVDFRDANLTRFQHKEIVFNPQTEDNITMFEGRECVNSYTAPKMLSYTKNKEVNNAWPLEIADFFRLLWNLSNEDDKSQLYIINWLSKNYQTKEPAQNFILFCGESGTGKGQLMSIINNIYGIDFIGSGSPENNIFISKENVSLKNSLYYHSDEIKITPDIWESSKNFIANNKFTLKANFENVRTYPNYASFIFNSNNRKGQIPFNIPTDLDRRVTAIESYTPLNTTKWFNHHIPNKFEMDKIFAKNVAHFLADFDYDKQLLSYPLNNDLRNRMLKAGKPNIEKFGEALFNRDMDWFYNVGIDSFDWINADGRRAAAYTWTEHLEDAFEEGYIRTVSVKTLYKLIFDDKEYKKESLEDIGLHEKNKRIDINGQIKQAKVFMLPKITIEKEEEIEEIEEIDEFEELYKKMEKETKPKPKKKKISGARYLKRS